MRHLYLAVFGFLATPSWAQAPILTNRTPAANSIAPVNTALQLTFDRPMSTQAATATAIRVVSNRRGVLLGTFSGAGTNTIRFTPAHNLLPGEAVQVSVTPRATSQAGIAPVTSVHSFIAAALTGSGHFPGFEYEDLIPGVQSQTDPLLVDVNHDMKIDLLAVSNNTLFVQLGNGQGGFTAAGTLPIGTGTEPNGVAGRRLAAGDVNGDGHPDVLVTADSPSRIRVRLGDGQGGFTVAPDVAVGFNPADLVLSDVNKDGRLDILTANAANFLAIPNSNTVSVRLGNGQGGFSGTTDVVVGDMPVSVALGDVNGDGNMDFATADARGNTATVRLGNGLGSFSGGQSISVGQEPVSVRLADINGDGNLDLLVANKTGNTVSVRLGNGQGGFSGTTNVPTGAGPRSLVLADVNRDNQLDLLVATQFVNTIGVSIRLGNGSGGFTGTTQVSGPAIGALTMGLGAADLDGDQYPDLVLATGNVLLRPNNGQGGFLTPPVGPRIPVGNGSEHPAVADINGDGYLDFLTTYRPNPTTTNTNPNALVSIRLGDGAAGFVAAPDVAVGSFPSGLTLGDVNEDGHLDLLAPNYNLSSSANNADGVTVTLRLGNGQGGFTNGPDVSVGAGPKQVVLADVNGDGHLDLLVPTSFSAAHNGAVSVRLGNGQGNFSGNTEANVGTGTFRDPMQLAVADMNNDGKLDLLTANRLANSVSLRLGDGQGNFSGGREISVGELPYALATGDINKDGNLDLLTANSNTTANGSNSVSVHLGDGQGSFTAAPNVPTTGHPNTNVSLADLNADGNLDLLTGTQSGQNLNALAGISVSFGTGQGTFGSSYLLRASSQFAVGDVDRDGDLDVLVISRADQIGLRLNGGSTGTVLATGTTSPLHPAASTLAVYPNPAHYEARISGLKGQAPLLLLTSQGRVLRQLPGGTTTLDLRTLSAGLYLLRQGKTTTRFMVE